MGILRIYYLIFLTLAKGDELKPVTSIAESFVHESATPQKIITGCIGNQVSGQPTLIEYYIIDSTGEKKSIELDSVVNVSFPEAANPDFPNVLKTQLVRFSEICFPTQCNSPSCGKIIGPLLSGLSEASGTQSISSISSSSSSLIHGPSSSSVHTPVIHGLVPNTISENILSSLLGCSSGGNGGGGSLTGQTNIMGIGVGHPDSGGGVGNGGTNPGSGGGSGGYPGSGGDVGNGGGGSWPGSGGENGGICAPTCNCCALCKPKQNSFLPNPINFLPNLASISTRWTNLQWPFGKPGLRKRSPNYRTDASYYASLPGAIRGTANVVYYPSCDQNAYVQPAIINYCPGFEQGREIKVTESVVLA